MRNRRLSVLGHYPAYLTANESSSEHVFRLARLVLCGSNNLGAGKKVRRVEQKGAGIGGGKKGVKKIVIVEEWERAWAYLRAVRSSFRFSIASRLFFCDDSRSTTLGHSRLSPPSPPTIDSLFSRGTALHPPSFIRRIPLRNAKRRRVIAAPAPTSGSQKFAPVSRPLNVARRVLRPQLSSRPDRSSNPSINRAANDDSGTTFLKR